jgi:hypothetical protein
MEIEKLFRGVGLIIDDQVNKEDSDDSIQKIKEFFEKKNIPLVKLSELPDKKMIPHLSELNFILLDWQLVPYESDENGNPLPIPEQLKERKEQKVLQFLQELVGQVFAPIFIFSNEDKEHIMNQLKQSNILTPDKSLPLFVESKQNLLSDNGDVKVFELIEGWIKSMLSIYVMKVWKGSMQSAMTALMNNLSQIDSDWPAILWQTYLEDKVNPAEELESVLRQNVIACMNPLSLEEEFFKKNAEDVSQQTLRKILSSLCFIDVNNETASSTGDLYKYKKHYYVNIRPSCDCVSRIEGNQPYVYLLRCDSFNPKNEDYNTDCGNFIEKSNEAIVGPMYKEKFYRVLFKDMEIKTFNEFKAYRVGRIIPPYITHITERYALYMQRQGLHRIPELAVIGTKPKWNRLF